MSVSRVQLVGGSFQDSNGEVLSNGYLILKLSQDEVVNSSQVCSGIEIKVLLDQDGSVVTSTPQNIWGNDQLLLANSYYRVTGYSSKGQISWGPNSQQVVGDGGTFDVGTWSPNSVISWNPPVTSTLLLTDNVINSVQGLLNLKAGTNIELSEAAGAVTISSTGGSVPAGANVYPTFSTINGTATGGSGAGRTAATVMSGRQLINTPATWTFSLSVNGGGVDLGPMVVLKTLIDDLNVLSSTTVRFGGSTSPSLADGIHTSDPVALQLDTLHDFWIMYLIHASSLGWVDFGPNPGPTAFLNALGHGEYWTGNTTGDNPIVIPSSAGRIGSQLNQVLAA